MKNTDRFFESVGIDCQKTRISFRLEKKNPIRSGGVYGARSEFFEGEPANRRKNRYTADFTPEIFMISVKSGEGGSGGGACFPVHKSGKNTFLTD